MDKPMIASTMIIAAVVINSIDMVLAIHWFAVWTDNEMVF
jgi:hypothetical protein